MKNVTRRMIAVFVALVMVMTCSVAVFAASSPTVGKITGVESSGTTDGKTLTVKWVVDKAADKYIVKVGSDTYETTATTLTVNTVPNTYLPVSVTPVYGGKQGATLSGLDRWMKSTKIKKAKALKKKVKLTWKKVKGADRYQVLMLKNGSWQVVKTTKKLSATIKVGKKGTYKFKVRPMKGNWYGVRSATKKGKAK